MRVTENTNFDAIRNSIARSKSRLEDLQLKTSSMKKVNTPSDNPVGASKILEIRTDKVLNEQYLMNAKLAESFLENTDHALGELSEIVVRAKEIAIGQSSGASSNDDTRLGVAEEITQLYNQAISVANRRVGDRYLFGGYKTNKPPVDPDGKYRGDDGHMMVEIARDVFLSMNVPGNEAFNTKSEDAKKHGDVFGGPPPKSPTPSSPDREPVVSERGPASVANDLREMDPSRDPGLQYERDNVNVFQELQNLRISLLTGDLEGIRGTLESLDGVHGSLVANRSKVGSRMQGLQSTAQAMERHTLTNAQLNAQLEDADMAQVVSDMAKEETILKSSLASSKHLIQPTLLDFLR